MRFMTRQSNARWLLFQVNYTLELPFASLSRIFFLISKKIILKRHKRTKTTQRIQRGEQKEKRKEKKKNKNTRKSTKTNYKEEN